MTAARLLLSAASGLWSLAHPGITQKPTAAWQLDPYTKSEPAAMQRAGYLSFGPLPWGDDHDTRKIHAMMPEAKILWVETAHFRIGSALKSLPMPKASKDRRRLVRELSQLRAVLPTVKARPRKLDRWLRLHLYAYRVEKLYTQVQGLLRVTDASFPRQRLAEIPVKKAADFMGMGRYFGMGDKYLVLLLQKASNLTRYSVKVGQPQPAQPQPIAISFLDRGSMLFGTCTEIVFHSHHPDHRLHANVLFNVSQLLLRGYRHYAHVLPAWIIEGFANSMVIDWDPSQHDFSGMTNWDHTKSYPKKWAVNCRRLIKNDLAPSGKKLCTVRASSKLTFNDQMCAWSRVNYLRQIGDGDEFAEFLALLKAPMPHEPLTNPTFETILAAQGAALQTAFGMGWAEFDAGWKQYCLAKYPRR